MIWCGNLKDTAQCGRSGPMCKWKHVNNKTLWIIKDPSHPLDLLNRQFQMVSVKCSPSREGKVRELLITFIVDGKTTDTSVIADLRFWILSSFNVGKSFIFCLETTSSLAEPKEASIQANTPVSIWPLVSWYHMSGVILFLNNWSGLKSQSYIFMQHKFLLLTFTIDQGQYVLYVGLSQYVV